MIRSSFVVEGYEHYDVDRKHKYPLPPAELTYIEFKIELIYENCYCREYRKKSNEFHKMKIEDILYFISDVGTEYIS
jgi:hypothetical protein